MCVAMREHYDIACLEGDGWFVVDVIEADGRTAIGHEVIESDVPIRRVWRGGKRRHLRRREAPRPAELCTEERRAGQAHASQHLGEDIHHVSVRVRTAKNLGLAAKTELSSPA
jgi:hypothetical protein